MDFYVGVSGFSYAGWKGRFYPKDAKSEEFLTQYSQRLGSVEINSSFYAPPRSSVVKGWSERTSEKFRFSFKAPKLITHVLKLGKGSSEATDKFSKTLDFLGPRRGPVLFQLPPFMKQDLEVLESFLSETSGIHGRVFEFRHESWLQESTYQALEKHGAGFCIADTEDMSAEFRVTGGLAYFRLRKDSYGLEDVEWWADKIASTARGTGGYAYFRHDETGENALLAQKLAEKLQSLGP